MFCWRLVMRGQAPRLLLPAALFTVTVPAEVSKARRLLGYAPSHGIAQGLDLAMDWYRKNLC